MTGYWACPICNSETSVLSLRRKKKQCKGGKHLFDHRRKSKKCYLGHRCYLPRGHSWRDHVGCVKESSGEHRLAPIVRSGEEILLSEFNSVPIRKPEQHPNNSDRKRPRSKLYNNWRILVQIEG